MNFWLFLLSGLINITQGLLVWMFGGPENYHHAMGFSAAIGSGLQVFIDVFFSTFGVFNWTLPFIAIALYLPIWMIQSAIRIWYLIRRVFLTGI